MFDKIIVVYGMKKRQIKKFFSENKIYIFTIFYSIILIGIIYFLQNITPLGKNGLLDVDFFHQYCPFMFELYNRIKSFSMSTYSFTMGLGSPFFRNYLTYLSSPLNLIMIFFSKKGLLTSFSIIIALKEVLAATLMVYYLCNKFHKKKAYFILLGLSYALSGYFTAYYWNLMWFDGVYLLPLVVLGIEKLIDEGKWKLYTLSLTISIFSNYFIGYMICIFSVVYFLIYLILNKNVDKGKRVSLFVVSSLIAGSLLAFLLIPQFYAFTTTSASTDTMPDFVYYPFTIFEILQKHFSGVISTTPVLSKTDAPNIYAGVLSLLLALMFIFNHKIETRVKLAYLLLLVLMILPFFIPQLDFILHAFHIPNDLPYRYSFLYIFVLVVISAYSFEKLDKVKFKYAIAIFTIIMIFLVVLLLNKKLRIISVKNLYTNIIIIILYFVCYLLIRYTKFKKVVFILALGILSYELVNNTNTNWNIDQNVKEFNTILDEYGTKVRAIKKQDSDDLFYRIATDDFATCNDSSMLNYYGFTSFSSMNSHGFNEFQSKLGIKNNGANSYIYSSQTPVFDMMFDIKYMLIKRKNNLEDYKLINDDTFKFKYNNSIAFAVPTYIRDWKCSSKDALKNQNDFISITTGMSPFTKITDYDKELIEENDGSIVIKYSLHTNATNLYAFIENDTVNYYIINDVLYYRKEEYESKVDTDINYSEIRSDMEYSVIEMNGYDDIYISYDTSKGKDKFRVYSFDNDTFINAYKRLSSGSFKITDFKEHRIEGTITTKNNMVLYTSIPYDKGWKVYVDDKQVKTYALVDAVLAADIPAGNHKVILKYNIYGMKIGMIISLIALYVLLFYDKIKVILAKRFGDKYEHRHNSSSKKRRRKHRINFQRNKKKTEKQKT